MGLSVWRMATEHADKLNQLREVRDEALVHYRRAIQKMMAV